MTSIKIAPEKCTNCLACQLICSYQHTRSFNPSKSRIKIKPGYFKNGTWISNQISFENCVKGCRLCINYCAYGAITVDK